MNHFKVIGIVLGVALLGVGSVARAEQGGAVAKVDGLRVEYLKEPLGIETARPRLSWKVETGERRGVKQGAYRVRVATEAKKLSGDAADLWDGGKVASDRTVLVQYAGKALASRQRCYWDVEVWDAKGESLGRSAVGTWEMGLLAKEDWKAKWVAAQPEGKREGKEYLPAPLMRKGFEVKGEVRRARAYVCGLGYYELRLNGKKVGDHELDPAYTNSGRRALYVTYDVTEQVRSGKNAIGIMLGTGWYDVHTLAVWDFHKAPWRGVPKAIVQVEIELADGSRQVVVSDEGWRWSEGPITFDSIYGGENYDARREVAGWDTAAFDDAAWKPVNVVDGPKGALHAQQVEAIKVAGYVEPKSAKEVKPGVWVVDLGQNFAGVPEITATGAAGTTVRMRCGERVKADGSLDVEAVDVFVRQRGAEQQFQEDRYTLKGEGKEVWRPRFTYHGFQYVEVTGLPVGAGGPGGAGGCSVRGVVLHTAFDRVGGFECSNELLNRIYAAGVWSYVSNMQGIPTDCPQREKNGWTGDAHLAAEQGMLTFDGGAVYTKWLDDVADAQRKEGDLPGIVPTGGWGYGANIGPAWGSVYVLMPWYMYEFYGDTRILERHYDGMKWYVEYLNTQAKEGVMPIGLGDWCPYETETPNVVTSTGVWYRDAVIVSEVARLLGKGEDAAKYAALAERIRKAFNGKFYDAKTGLYANGSQTALSTALYQGMVEPSERARVSENLVGNIGKRKDHLDVGILGCKYVMNVLSENGRTDLGYRIAGQEDLPSWGWWIRQGATTLWEQWKGTDSRNHIMFGDVNAWMVRYVAGVRSVEPGFGKVEIGPGVVGDLAWARAHYDSVHGRIGVDWRREGERLAVNVEVPANVVAVVRLPARAGQGVFEGAASAERAEGVKPVAGSATGERVFEVGSGRYRFEVR